MYNPDAEKTSPNKTMITPENIASTEMTPMEFLSAKTAINSTMLDIVEDINKNEEKYLKQMKKASTNKRKAKPF